MKRIFTLIYGIMLITVLTHAQNDSIYFMKSGAIILRQSIKEADLDSIIFYNPFELIGSVTDIDGNVYQTVRIGNQCWMAENLKVTHYRNGDSIPNITVNSAWDTLNTGAWCDYENNISNSTKYGHLYNWYAVNDLRNIAPVGWHVPLDSEWSTLENYVSTHLGVSSSIAKALAATTNWPEDAIIGQNILNNNSTGFTALPAGNRDGIGVFWNLGSTCFWWSSTENYNEQASTRNIYCINNEVLKGYYGKRFGLSIRCIKDNINAVNCPILTTQAISLIGQLTATSGGNITSDGGFEVAARGVCWSTNPNPTIEDSKTSNETGIGEFTCRITGLIANTIYYLRAYATNRAITCYGNEISFKTKDYIVENCGSVTDIDGNVYQTVRIGNQCWMVENLRTTRYNDGTAIPLVNGNSSWVALSTPAYCWYNDDVINKNTFGAYYNWHAINTGKLAPTGWHVPSDAEWTDLENYLIANGYNYDGTTTGNKIAKSLAVGFNWIISENEGAIGNDQTKNNSTGFNGISAGGRNYETGVFNEPGYNGMFWSSTENSSQGWLRTLYNVNNYVYRGMDGKSNGLSVRCVKD